MEKRHPIPLGNLHVTQSDQHSPPGYVQKSLDPSLSPPLSRRETPRSLASPGTHRSNIPASLTGRLSMTSMSPPMLDRASHHQQTSEPPSGTESRSLPPRDISDATVNDAYTAFILYCNPNVPLSTDTAELRRVFRSPPRSDGKNFSVYTLWELIGKLERKELKTWIQLAIELGVEPPSAEKKQSTQKVQQYAVRLKRWMRAMHVDAFFEYCLGNAHPYYTQLPSFNGSTSDTRDGVPLEEDLALRALVPEWKPKRGRKRVEDKEHDDSKYAKRLHIDMPVGALDSRDFGHHSAIFPRSAIPWSAYPEDTGHHDPWSAVSAFPPEAPASVGALTPQPHGSGRGRKFKWRLNGRESSPSSQYPQSAITPRGGHDPDPISYYEPQSAIVSSSIDKSQMRRRHGPAVSSAWPNNAPAGKPRGRPPNTRATRDGQFSTFPAHPDPSRVSPVLTVAQTPVQNTAIENDVHTSAGGSTSQRPNGPFQPLNSKPSKLQLQVPQRSGGPIRLATPPTLLINGENNTPTSTARPMSGGQLSVGSSSFPDENEIETVTSNTKKRGHPYPSNFNLDDVARSFSEQILRGNLLNRTTPLEAEEAKLLAEKTILQLKLHSSNSLPPSALVLYCAAYLGVGHQLGLGGDAPGPITATANPRSPTNGTKSANSKGVVSEIEYTLRFKSFPATGFAVNTTIGNLVIPAFGLRGRHGRDDFTAQFDNSGNSNIIRMTSPTSDLDDEGLDDSILETTWKQRYLNLRKQVRSKDAALGRYKMKIMETVMMDV